MSVEVELDSWWGANRVLLASWHTNHQSLTLKYSSDSNCHWRSCHPSAVIIVGLQLTRTSNNLQFNFSVFSKCKYWVTWWMLEREYFLWKTWSQAGSLLLTGEHHLDRIFWSGFFFIQLSDCCQWWWLIITNCYWFPPCFLLTITDYYLLLMIITDYYWLLLIMIINVDFTPNYDLSITWFSLLPIISNDLSSPQEQEEMQNPLVLHLLCFPTGLWLKFSEPDLQMKFSGLGLQLNIFWPGRLQQRLSRLWDKLLLLGIGLKN